MLMALFSLAMLPLLQLQTHVGAPAHTLAGPPSYTEIIDNLTGQIGSPLTAGLSPLPPCSLPQSLPCTTRLRAFKPPMKLSKVGVSLTKPPMTLWPSLPSLVLLSGMPVMCMISCTPCKTHLQMAQVSPEQHVSYASTFLEGGAFRYYRSLIAATPDIAITFANGLKLRFGNVNQSDVARDQLHFKQTGHVEPYYRRFMQLCAEITDVPLSESDKVMRFRDGLNHALPMQVSVDPNTFKRYTSLATLTYAPQVAGAFGRSLRQAHQPFSWTPCRDSQHGHGWQNAWRRKRPSGEATGEPAKRSRSAPDVWLSEQDKAMVTFPKKEVKATGECFFKNCNGVHYWKGCPKTDNKLVVARGRLAAVQRNN